MEPSVLEEFNPAASLEPQPPYAVNERFVPRTAHEVEWVLQHITEARARISRVHANAAVMIAEAEKEVKYFEDRFRPDLEAFARAEIERSGGRTKTVKMLNGSLSLKNVPGNITLADGDTAREEAIAWAKMYLPDAVLTVTTTKLDLVMLKEKLTFGMGTSVVDADTGEAIEWAQAKPAEERLYIK